MIVFIVYIFWKIYIYTTKSNTNKKQLWTWPINEVVVAEMIRLETKYLGRYWFAQIYGFE